MGDNKPFDNRPLYGRLDLNFALKSAGLGVWELDPVTNVILWDDRCQQLFGLSNDNQLPLEQAIQHIHPEDLTRVTQAIEWAYNPASGGAYDVTYRTLGADDGLLRWVRFWGQSYFTPEGELYRFSGVAQEVTQQVMDQQRIEASETKLRGLIAAAPIAIGLLVGRDLVIENPNQPYIEIVGKGPHIEGLALRQVMPEMLEYGQPFVQILDDIFTTGTPFIAQATPAKIVQDGVLTEKYYNIYYSPIFNESGEVYAISTMGVEVSEEVKAQQQLQEAETVLRGAIEVADMGTWTLNMETGLTTYSNRLRELFEFTQDYIEQERLYNPILESDRARLVDAVAKASNPESGGLLDEEYTVITQQTGRHRIVRAQAKMFFDPQGRPTKLVGSMRDVTEQRQTQLALEQLVKEQTEELAAANEELAANNEELESNNEEYAAINEELEESNRLLARSNENLQKFAYVASHDLQEPLSKIQQFGDLLKSSQALLSGDDISYIDRMQSASRRMATLIRDLLDYSRLSTQQAIDTLVPLNGVITQVLSTLELVTAETQAEIIIDPLPIVEGNEIQLIQLFQNLLGNALKFRRPSVTPVIHINAQQLNGSELPATIKPVRSAQSYHRIDVVDNGVGFDEKYLDRIFQVFQRLYGKNEFAGTGIGLAICEKVVTNHGGAITASSQPGQGATFSIYLPA
ncbi:PAS domain-containing protein [Spirosoma sp. BT702]|uniref:histidine kinase n=1 Tax=Spirosoma profusum TaxID=2771354 RepID=A0A927AS52_9BACT|nr:ATP-binding protein [Spirosoma profusum]MBD2703333.1 PAS domain-containing protein [Spirosoma profusum]